MATDQVLIVGAGVAGVATARALRSNGYQGRVCLVSAEPIAPYDRPPLSKQLLTGTMSTADVVTLTSAQADELSIDVRLADPAVGADTSTRTVQLSSGAEVGFDQLVVATGSRPRRLPVASAAARIHYLRDLPDALGFREALHGLGSLVIVGGGFIGLEIASVARERGIDVTVVEADRRLLSRVVDEKAADIIEQMHRERAVSIRCSTQVLSVAEDARGLDVTLSDGTHLRADAMMVGIGAVPNVEWLRDDSVLVDNGVVCASDGMSSVDGVYAVGDVSRWCGAWMPADVRIEQWQAALEQAGVVGRNIAEPGQRTQWQSVPYFWSDQYGRKIQLCGRTGEHSEVFRTARGPVVLYRDELLLCGLLAVHQPRVVAQGRRMLSERTTWAEAAAWGGSLVA
jgi:3-phenylpropionate/trans-cinnamate dioxygenase ferredoxin reductase subunit